LAVLSVVVAGAVKVRPPPGAANVTAIVAVPVSAVAGLTMIVPGAPGPVEVLQVTATVAVTVKVDARIVLAHIVSAISPPRAKAPRFFNTDKSIEDPFFIWCLLHDMAGRQSS
jgi:hypothetical protein